jgi:hypothetical protein
MVILGCYYLYKGSGQFLKPFILVALMVALISRMFFLQDPEIVTTNMVMRAFIPLVINSLFVALAYWIERKKEKIE